MKNPKKVLFIQMGSHHFTASIVEFSSADSGSAKVLATACDSNFGTYTIDIAIAEKFAEEFNVCFLFNDFWSKSVLARTMKPFVSHGRQRTK